MEFRDVVHGSISIEPYEVPIIESPFFQRLRHIRQMGFAEHSFPCATHNRFSHSLGAMHTASQAFSFIFQKEIRPEDRQERKDEPWLFLATQEPKAYARFRAIVRLAALLHDIGHGPLSHTTEFAMPARSQFLGDSKASGTADHEDYTLKILLESPLTPLLNAAGKKFGFQARHIASLIDPEIRVTDSFFSVQIDGVSISFHPLLCQLISSELDADRMDYLRRDSYHAGTSYGFFDFDWLAANLTTHLAQGHLHLALHHRALYTFEDFLISRFHMFMMVYYHHKTVIYDEMLREYFQSAPGEYTLPTDIVHYLDYTDAHLHEHLTRSKNPWAKRIVQNRPWVRLLELHSNPNPAGPKEQKQLMAELETRLNRESIPYLRNTSTGELSKYFGRPATPLFVRHSNHLHKANWLTIGQCTDLFEKFSKKRTISRIYVDAEHLSRAKTLGS